MTSEVTVKLRKLEISKFEKNESNISKFMVYQKSYYVNNIIMMLNAKS